jgi:hypothetical protein
MRTYPDIGIQVGEILLPGPSIDLTSWATIACDQFTSEPEYWQQVAHIVADAPSTYNLVLPEVFLGTPEESARVQGTQGAMRAYMDQGILRPHQGMILVERSVAGKTRHGLMLALDLEAYDFRPGSRTLIRATEGTILDRLPPRIRIREGAPLELPHILVLIDDPAGTVIEPLAAAKANLPLLYDTPLMLDSGHLSGYDLSDPALEAGVVSALRALADPGAFHARYHLPAEQGVLLFAMGDGNHSFATAKAIWDRVKTQVGLQHPARYALVEIENIHDQGLDVEPIHRVVFDIREDVFSALERYFHGQVSHRPCAHPAEMIAHVKAHAGPGQAVGLVTPQGAGLLTIQRTSSNLPVGTLQPFLDDWLQSSGAGKIDYIHGEDILCRLGAQPGQAGFYLPAMPKTDLFKTVLLDGALPRKTFSMGEAREKRFYFEARRIA